VREEPARLRGIAATLRAPTVGAKALATVSAFDIQALYRELLDRNLSARSIRYTHAVLRSALKQAVRWNLILANPAGLVDLSRQNRRCGGVLSVEQARAFIRGSVEVATKRCSPSP
jgi:site-specific recombinase XerD